jgi:glycerol-3-phosphate dehydrogenase
MGHTWVGTTDTDFEGDPATASATDDDVRYLTESLAPQLPAIRTARKYWTGAGVRALVRSDGSPSGVSRMHRISTGTPGLVSVIGGKLTGYRAIAEEVVDGICRELGTDAPCTTATTPLPGGGPERSGVPHLDALYGSRAPRVQAVLERDAPLGRRLAQAYPDTMAQVVYAVRHEWAERRDDVMLRRTYLGFQPDRGGDAIDAIDAAMTSTPSQA